MRTRWAAFIGNFFEHYDNALFGLLAPFLAPLLFPSEGPLQSLVYTYALFPLGILSKPFGAIFFGRLGDRIGRSKTLSLTLIGMAIVTGAMGFLPFFQGSSAPIWWGICRLLQGFFAAGETTGGAIYLLEKLKEEKRCFWGSVFDASGILGILAASAASILVFCRHISCCWLFWAGALTGLIGAAIRLSKEDPSIPTAIPLPPESAWRLFWMHKKTIGRIALVAGFSYANYFLLTTFMNGFLPLVSSISPSDAIGMNTGLLTLDLCLLPLFGALAEKIGKEKWMRAALIGAVFGAIPLLSLAEGAGYWQAVWIRVGLTCIGAALAAPYHAWALEQAPPAHRYFVGALGVALGSRLIGAPGPALSLWLYQQTGLVQMAAIPTFVAALLALSALMPRKGFQTSTARKI